MKEFLLNRKSLVKFGKWSVGLVSVAFLTYFVFNILLAFANFDAAQTYVNTSLFGDKLSANGTEENFNFTITISAGNVSQVNITVPGNTAANFTIDNSTAGKIPAINATGTWTVTYTNYSGDTETQNISFTIGDVGQAFTGSVQIDIVATPKITDSIDNSTQQWNITLVHNESTQTNFTSLYTFVDSNAPRFGNTIPLDNGYITGTSRQNFTVAVTDLHLNTSNVSVTFDIGGGGSNATALTCTGSGADGYGCSVLLDLGPTKAGENDVINFYFDGSDNAGNQGSNGTASSKRSVTIDKTAPQWGNITMPGNRTYAPGISYTFNATWTDNFLLDTVLIEHNFTGTVTNYTITQNQTSNFGYTYTHIPAGVHQVRWYANDSVTNLTDNNAQRNKTEIQWIQVSVNTSTADFLHIKLNDTADANKSYTYPEAVNATGYKDISEGRVTLYRNGTNVTAEGSSTNEAMNETLLGNATYNFTVYYPATQNYSEAQNTTYAFVNKGSATLTLTLNGTEANTSFTYNNAVNATGNKSSTVGSAFNLTLLRDGVAVATTLTADAINENIVLAAATYNYTLIFNGSTNYTDTSISTNRFATVNRGTTNLTMFMNDTATTNFTVATGQVLNVSVLVNNSQGNVSLWRNGSLSTSSTTSQQINFNETYTGHPNQAFNMTGFYAQSENFTANLSTFYVFIENTLPREITAASANITNATVIGKYMNGTINITSNWTDNFELDSHWLSSNETGSFVNASGNKFVAGNYSNITIDPSGNDFNPGEVFQAIVYVNDTSNNQNQSATFQWTVDGTAPVISSPTPANFTFINGGSSELFSVTVVDDTLNATNATLHWKFRGGAYNSVSLTCSSDSGTTYTCNATVDLSAQPDGRIIDYFFNASDGSQLTSTLPADPTGPFNVTIDRNAPQFTNFATNASTVSRFGSVNVSVRWTDNQNLSYAVLETNESGSALNKSAYGSPFAFAVGDHTGRTVTFNWTNSSVAPGDGVRVRVFANDTEGQGNVTGFLNFTIDGTVPVAHVESVNTTNNTIIERGATINLTANWTDGLELHRWWIRENVSDTFTNSSGDTFQSGNFSVGYINTSSRSVGDVLQVRIYANDTSDNQNSTQLYQWTIDSTAPQWFNSGTNTTNGTTVRRGASINVSANWTDQTQLFRWWAQHNATSDGSTTNTSLQTFSSTSTGNWSNYTLDTSNAVRGNGIFVRIYANDTSDNVNQSINPYFEYIVDGTLPQSANISTSPTSAVTYSPGVNYTFNVSFDDNIGVDKVTFEWNGTDNYTDGTAGTLGAEVKSVGGTNYSISLYDLGVSTGNYTYRWLANDTSDNWNATTTQTFNITLNTTASTLMHLAFNNTADANATVTYPAVTNATAYKNFTEGNVQLFRNGTSLGTGASVESNVRLGNATWNFTTLYAATQNYSSASRTFYVFVNQGTVTITLALNGTEANRSVTYPGGTNATMNKSATHADSTFNISLYRDGVIVASSTSADAISENIILANGTFNYTAVFTSTNYTNTSITDNRFALINRGATNISLFLNNNETNITIEQGIAANFTATINTTYSVTFNITVNITSWGTLGNTSLSLQNTTATGGVSAGLYNVTAFFDSDQNFSSTSRTLFLNLTADATGPTIRLFEYTNGTANRAGNSLTLNVSVTDTGVGQTGTVNVTIGGTFAGLLNRSGTSEWYNGTVIIPSSLSDGNQTITLNISDTIPNVGTNSSFIATIDSTAPTITITLPNNNTFYRINVSTFVWINGTVSDNVRMGSGNVSSNNTNFAVFNFTGGNNTAFSFNNTTAIAEGQIAVLVNYSDEAGNVQNITVEWTVDNTAPSTIIAETNSSTQFYPENTSLTIRVRVDDAGQTNGTITLKYYINASWQSAAMTGTPGTSTRYTAAISTRGNDYKTDSQGRSYIPYYVEGVDNATNNLASVNGSADVPLANITLSTTGTVSGYIFLTNTTSTVPNTTSALTVSDGTRSSSVNTAGFYQINSVPAGTYTVTVSGTGYRANQTASVTVTEGVTTQVNMSVTGPENFNITLPGTAGSSTSGYWDSGWHQFNFRTGVFSAGTTNYTVENLFLTAGVTGSYNYTAVWRYNQTSTSWTSFIPKASGNTLVNISSSDDSYWVFMNATDRAEMESRYT